MNFFSDETLDKSIFLDEVNMVFLSRSNSKLPKKHAWTIYIRLGWLERGLQLKNVLIIMWHNTISSFTLNFCLLPSQRLPDGPAGADTYDFSNDLADFEILL